MMRAALTLVLLLVAWPVEAQTCDQLALAAHRAAVEGTTIPNDLNRCRGDISKPPAGSGNWPIQLEGVLYATGKAHRDLRPWLAGGEVWGHNGREFGSTIYEPRNTSTALLVRHSAKRFGDTDLARLTASYLRAQWAKQALAATPSPPARISYYQGDHKLDRARLNQRTGYHGPFVHLPGERQAENPKRGTFTGAWVEDNAGHAFLAWAADFPGRRYRKENIGPGALAGPLWTVRKLTGRRYASTVPPEVFGLTETERRNLRDFLRKPTDPSLARIVGSWLDGYPMRRDAELTFRRYRSGSTLAVLSKVTNANKSGAPVVLGTKDRSTWLLPSTYKGVKAVSAFGSIDGDRAVARSKEGRSLEVSLRGLGDVAWSAVWSSNGLRFHGDEAQPPPASPSAQAPVSPTPVSPSPGASTARYRAAYSALDLLAREQRPEAERLTRVLGGLLFNLEQWERNPSADSRGDLLSAYRALGKTVGQIPP